MTAGERAVREQEFWDIHVPTLERTIREVETGPDANTARALARLLPLEGRSVLDIGCGAGVFSAWLAARGARVTGIDVSSGLVARARELHAALGLESRFVTAPVSSHAVGGPVFDRLAGRHVLHHLDPPSIALDLAALLRPGGKAAFVETMGLNPILRFARARLTGRFGIPRYGTDDERPLTREDLAALEDAFGTVHLETAEMQFLRILDRQLLHYRSPLGSRLLSTLDDLLLVAGGGAWSYHQIVFLIKVPPGQP